MRLIIVKVLLFVIIGSANTFADMVYGVFYSPGVKLGLRVGGKTEFVIGFENSIVATYLFATPYAGVVGGIEWKVCRPEFIKYWEVESGMGPIGFAYGGEWCKGYHQSFRFFAGGIGFISYKRLFDQPVGEFAVIGKIPLGIYEETDMATFLFGREIRRRE